MPNLTEVKQPLKGNLVSSISNSFIVFYCPKDQSQTPNTVCVAFQDLRVSLLIASLCSAHTILMSTSMVTMSGSLHLLLVMMKLSPGCIYIFLGYLTLIYPFPPFWSYFLS